MCRSAGMYLALRARTRSRDHLPGLAFQARFVGLGAHESHVSRCGTEMQGQAPRILVRLVRKTDERADGLKIAAELKMVQEQR